MKTATNSKPTLVKPVANPGCLEQLEPLFNVQALLAGIIAIDTGSNMCRLADLANAMIDGVIDELEKLGTAHHE